MKCPRPFFSIEKWTKEKVNSGQASEQTLNEAIKARDIMLATLKSRSDEYRASKNSATPAAKVTVAAGDFNF